MISYGSREEDTVLLNEANKLVNSARMAYKHGDYIYCTRTTSTNEIAQVNVNTPTEYKYFRGSKDCSIITSNEDNLWGNNGVKFSETDFENPVVYTLGGSLIFQVDNIIFVLSSTGSLVRWDNNIITPTSTTGGYLGGNTLPNWNSSAYPLGFKIDTVNNVAWILQTNEIGTAETAGQLTGVNLSTYETYEIPIGTSATNLEIYGDYILFCNSTSNAASLYYNNSIVAFKMTDIINGTPVAKKLSRVMYTGHSPTVLQTAFVVEGDKLILGGSQYDEKIYSFDIGDISLWDDATDVDSTLVAEVWMFSVPDVILNNKAFVFLGSGDGKLFVLRANMSTTNGICGVMSYSLPPLSFVDRVLIDTLSAIDIIYSSGNMQGQITAIRTAINRGFIYGEGSETLTNEILVSGLDTDVFGYVYDELTPNTTYYYKAFSEDSEGRILGGLISFLTSTQASEVKGNLSADGSPAVGVTVVCINMTTGLIIETAITDDKGGYSFVTETEDQYIIIAYGELEGVDYIHDQSFINSEETE